MIDGAERENEEWMDCKKERAKRAKRMNSNRENKEHRRALRRVCALLSVFVCAFILFAAIPVSAHQAENSHQFTLQIYGNANEDDTIDMRDVTYIKLVIFGKKPETELCDANYDGRISMLDVVQTKLIIVGKEGELTIVDSANRTVTVKKPIKQVVCCFPHALEALRTLNVPKEIIVGIAKDKIDTAFFPEIEDIPSVGWRWTPDIEAIVELEPDVVLYTAHTLMGAPETLDKMESAGLTVLCFNLNELDRIDDELIMLGYIFNRKEEAKEFIEWRDGILNAIREKVESLPEESKPKVYFEAAFEGNYYIYGKYAYIAEAGGRDIFDYLPGSYMSIDPEEVVKRNPDIIVKVAPWYVGGYGVDATDITPLKEIQEEVLSRPELQGVKAVKDGKVYVISNHLVSMFPSCGCRNFIQVAYMAKWFHPEIFKDLNPKAIHQEYLTRFQGLDIDLDENGVFVYPEPS